MKNSGLIAWIGLALIATAAIAGTVVDQGSPGKSGPWPVTGATPTFPSDGGTVNGGSIATYPYHCANASPNTKIFMDAGVQTIGGFTDGGSRLYIVVTNNGDDLGAGSGSVKCRSDGVNPSLTAGAPGALLGVGSSITYTNSAGAPVKCIGSSLWVGGFECAPP